MVISSVALLLTTIPYSLMLITVFGGDHFYSISLILRYKKKKEWQIISNVSKCGSKEARANHFLGRLRVIHFPLQPPNQSKYAFLI